MVLPTAPPTMVGSVAAYSARILSSPHEILECAGGSRQARFFLASLLEDSWIPTVIVVRHAGSQVGMMYAKERKVAGIRSGLIFADATMDSMIAAEPGRQAAVFEVAMVRLLESPKVRGARLLLPRDGFEYSVIQRVFGGGRLDVRSVRAANHSILSLPSSYELLLQSLGHRTRRNFRYYRRRFEASGHCLVERLTVSEFREAARHLGAKTALGAQGEAVDRAARMLAHVDQPILAGLRHKNGEWMSILAGWREGRRAVIFLQLNNERDFPHSSLSVVLRGYLLENLVAAGVTEAVFWAGAGGALFPYCVAIPAIGVYLDKPSILWRTSRRLIAGLAPLLPWRTARYARWVAPGDSEPLDIGFG